tara:strand:- start:1655 stop:1906 length:252 start_codon:yes stop_codon:yes gene_type:complete
MHFFWNFDPFSKNFPDFEYSKYFFAKKNVLKMCKNILYSIEFQYYTNLKKMHFLRTHFWRTCDDFSKFILLAIIYKLLTKVIF